MEKEPQLKPINPQEKIDMLKKLEKAKSTKERVDLFAKIMDTFGVDAVVSLVPELGDAGSSIVSSLYLLCEGKKMGYTRWDSLKILGYQTADVLVGAIPIIGDIADYFFKANKWSAKIFKKHFDRLKKEALQKGISTEEITAIENNNKQFIKIMKQNLASQMKTTNSNKNNK